MKYKNKIDKLNNLLHSEGVGAPLSEKPAQTAQHPLAKQVVRSELNLEKNAVFTVARCKKKSREIATVVNGSGGEIIKRSVIIGRTANGIETGVLTTNHFKVYLVLVELWEKAGRPINEPVHFTILKIIKRLKLNQDGRTYARIKRWLLNMGQIPLTFINSFSVPGGGLYQTLDPFHILSYLRIYEQRTAGIQHEMYGYGEFQFDRHILENLVNNYSHPMRLDVIGSFRKHRDLCILIYTYIDRNLALRERFEIRLDNLFKNLDLSQRHVKYPSGRKKVVDPVLEELRGSELSTGILTDIQVVQTADGADYKLVCRKKPFPKSLKQQEEPRQPELALPAQNESKSTVTESKIVQPSSELLSLLIEKGLTEKQAAKLIEENSPEIIKEQLKFLPFRVKEYEAQGKDIKDINEPAILHESIKGNWKVPQSYQRVEKEKERETERIEQEQHLRLKEEEWEEKEREKAKLEAYKQTLSPEARAELRERALREIRNIGEIKEGFISEVLIAVKENEILRREKEE